LFARRLLTCCAAVLLGTAPVAAQSVEISGSLGSTPYGDSQTVAYRVAAPAALSSFLSFETSDPTRVTTDGGLVLGGAIGWLFHPSASLEARIDAITLHVDPAPTVFRTRLSLPGTLLGTTQEVVVGPTQVASQRAVIPSVGARLRNAIGRVTVTGGGGVSMVPGTTLVSSLPVSVGSLAFAGFVLPLPVSVGVADVQLQGRTSTRVGGYVNGGVEIPLGRRLLVRPELRYIALQPLRVEWTEAQARTLLGPVGNPVGEPVTGLTSFDVRSRFLLLQMGVVARF
jgi:hypothetical protein